MKRNEANIQLIRDECGAQHMTLPAQVAYVLATVQHETNGTYDPVLEAYWVKNAEAWRKANLRYYPFYGRGFVQLTWKTNYEKYAKITGEDLVAHPDLALEPKTAAFILVHGFIHGTFTGRKIDDYISPGFVDFTNARRCINGTDRAGLIAEYAQAWLKVLLGK